MQDNWNQFENQILLIIDTIIPYVKFQDNVIKIGTPPIIKNKINIRNRLLKNFKRNPTMAIKERIRHLNCEIRNHFYSDKRKFVRKGILPGNSKSLWRAVNIAKDASCPMIPTNMLYDNNTVTGIDVPDSFANFFDNKVNNIVNDTNVDYDVHNGFRKIFANCSMFMGELDIIESIKGLKMKNNEGYDRIPQRVLIDGMDVLIRPLTKLFSMVYRDTEIPGQWLISKIVPIHKKGSKQQIENYRPVANLCSTSKIFERMILNRIRKLECLNGIELGGKEQHGFTRNKSTATAGLLIQSIIARALDDDNYVALASIDLSSAFDIVDVQLLLKRLRITGLPVDVVNLIEIWLKKRYFYVSVNGMNSTIVTSWHGIIQGSILGPILYAIFISPLFDLEKITCFADDKYAIEANKNKDLLAAMIQSKLERIIDWLTKSGMKVNEAKTDLCLFFKHDTTQITITLNQKQIISKVKINVLGVIFDSKLQWALHVAHAMKKATMALNAIRLISKFFNTKELLQLITSNFYSILFYNSEIWHLPTLNNNLRQKLLSSSAKAIKVCMKFNDPMISFVRLHEMAGRATPENLLFYKHALALFKLFNGPYHSIEFASLNVNLVLTPRQSQFQIMKTHRLKIGANALSNRLYVINGKIPLDWLNLTLDSFKINCKKLFLQLIKQHLTVYESLSTSKLTSYETS